MRTLARKLVVTALVVATTPVAALGCDRERDDREAAYPAPDRYAPAVQYASPVEYAWPDQYARLAIPLDQYAPPVRYAPPGQPPAWQDGGRPWREGSWRQRELAQIRAEMRELEARRSDFHARFGWSPGKARRFERWYAFRRAELERRYWNVQRVAWR